MPDRPTKTHSGAICEVLCIPDVRQKATATRHLVAAWKDAAFALGIVMTDGITHMSVGKSWFDFVCGVDRRDPVST